jgi:hypothetical protein
MKLYYIFILFTVIYILNNYSVKHYNDEPYTNMYSNLNIVTSKPKLLNIGIYNSPSNTKKLQILSNYMPINIFKYKNHLGIINNNNLNLLVIREYLVKDNDYYKFISGFNYEYFFMISNILELKNITDLKQLQQNVKIGVNNNDKIILQILIKILNLNNYELIVDENNIIFNKFYQNQIDVLFKICDEKDIYFNNLSSIDNFNILNIDIDYEIINKFISPIYSKTIPKYIINTKQDNIDIKTYCLRNIVVTNSLNNKYIQLFLEVIHYYNKEIIQDFQNYINKNYQYPTEFLKKNHLSFIVFNIKYHPESLKYFKNKKLIIHETI